MNDMKSSVQHLEDNSHKDISTHQFLHRGKNFEKKCKSKRCSINIRINEYSITCNGEKCCQFMNNEFAEYEKRLTATKWIFSNSIEEEYEDETTTTKELLRIEKRVKDSNVEIMKQLKKFNEEIEDIGESMNFNGCVLTDSQNKMKK
ncbi:hypothetical protein WA026_008411 [Henosepilachna vigintioctopunctata]|uniref:Uncharacterized protein n=1 Tax=Henosepilachna vigintioctopunctata TaxID=420089 RepID=A0AAW1UBK7_9CUCU